MPPRGISSYRPAVMGSEHMIATGNYLATSAGFQVLQQGGNAIDAGVASGIALNITIAEQTNIAGVAPIMVFMAETGQVHSITGVGPWAKAAELDSYIKRFGGTIPRGMARAVVPAACDAWLTALERFGTMSFEQVVAPSIELCERGLPVSRRMERIIEMQTEFISEHPTSSSIFMPGGRCPRLGERLRQEDMGRTFRRMIDAERGSAHKGREQGIQAARDLFYKGEIAEEMVRFCQEQGGLLEMDDLASYRAQVETPQSTSYRGYTVHTNGPWCQGPTLVQVLNLLEGFDLRGMGHNSTQYVHTLAEAIKVAFADRHQYYGDPDIIEVPIAGLITKEYADHRRDGIDAKAAWPEMPHPGNPWPFEGKSRTVTPIPAVPKWARPEPDTAYTCVVDRWGNGFSATPSDSFTSTPIVPGVGVSISGRGGQSWLDPENPNCLGPGKRPRMTPCAAMVLKDGRLFMPFGSPGEDMQVQAQLQVLLNIVEFGFDPQQAVEEPRFRSTSFPGSGWPHPYAPGELSVEGRMDAEVVKTLLDLGHKVNVRDDWMLIAGSPCAIVVDHERGALIAGAAPHRESYAIGW